ncbi:hypothetical protein GCM10009081_04590 [Brevundimonas nasdae]
MLGLGAPVGGETQAHAPLLIHRGRRPVTGPKAQRRDAKRSRAACKQGAATVQKGAIPAHIHRPCFTGG